MSLFNLNRTALNELHEHILDTCDEWMPDAVIDRWEHAIDRAYRAQQRMGELCARVVANVIAGAGGFRL